MRKTIITPSALSAFRLLLPFFSRHRLRLVSGLFALLAVNLCQLLIPRITRQAINGLAARQTGPEQLVGYGIAIIGLAVMIAGCRFCWRYLVIGFSRLLERDLRSQLIHRVLRLDITALAGHSSGDIMALATNDLAAVQLACGMGLVAGADALFMGLATFSFMAYIHPWLTIIALLPLPVLGFMTLRLSARLHQRVKHVQEQFAALTEFARTSFTHIKLLQAYTQEQAHCRRFADLGRRYIRSNLRVALVQGILYPISGFIAGISLLLILLIGGRLTISGQIDLGDFVAFMSYLFMLIWPMMAVGWVANLYQRGMTSLARINDLMTLRPVLNAPTGKQHHATAAKGEPSTPPSLTLHHLSFAYPAGRQSGAAAVGQRVAAGNGRPWSKKEKTGCQLNDFSFHFRQGLYGIVGPTGAGKSTLCQLLARLYPVPEQTIFYRGRDLNRIALASYRSQVAYVPQQIMLFADSIAANIAFGRPQATREQIRAVARRVLLDDEIRAMPDGYDSVIGERGVRLSGGQRQRLALARALLLNRPLLLIDDGLSAVDSETEAHILEAIKSDLRHGLCLFVSHRLPPLASAREILVLEAGRLADHGPHHELITRNAFYRDIYSYQMQDPSRGEPS